MARLKLSTTALRKTLMTMYTRDPPRKLSQAMIKDEEPTMTQDKMEAYVELAPFAKDNKRMHVAEKERGSRKRDCIQTNEYIARFFFKSITNNKHNRDENGPKIDFRDEDGEVHGGHEKHRAGKEESDEKGRYDHVENGDGPKYEHTHPGPGH